MLPGVMILLGLLALAVVATALGMLVSRNAMYSALFLVLNFSTVAVLYLVLGAPFIALVQITVYAGSIMVLFLFVIMLLGAERLPPGQALLRQRPLAILLALVFVAELILFLIYRGGMATAVVATPDPNFASPAAVGAVLFTKYALPFEVTGFILLVATVGAILLTRGTKPTRLTQKTKDEA